MVSRQSPQWTVAQEPWIKRGTLFFVCSMILANVYPLIMAGMFVHGLTTDEIPLENRWIAVPAIILLVVPINVVLVTMHLRTRVIKAHGVLRRSDGKEFEYLIGDTLPWYDGQDPVAVPLTYDGSEGISAIPRHYRGLLVRLPVTLPHIYLDTQQDIGRLTPFAIAGVQRIDLEGNFPAVFRMYAPQDAEIEVLSVFQPDVMQTILHHGGDYDIEIYGDSLRIISRPSVYRHSNRQHDILVLAQKIIDEVDGHMKRLQSRAASEKPTLRIYRYRGFRLGSRYVPVRAILWGTLVLLPVPFFIASPWLSWRFDIQEDIIIALTLLFFTIIGLPAAMFFAAVIRQVVVVGDESPSSRADGV